LGITNNINCIYFHKEWLKLKTKTLRFTNTLGFSNPKIPFRNVRIPTESVGAIDKKKPYKIGLLTLQRSVRSGWTSRLSRDVPIDTSLFHFFQMQLTNPGSCDFDV
jgi:hypothetical protein